MTKPEMILFDYGQPLIDDNYMFSAFLPGYHMPSFHKSRKCCMDHGKTHSCMEGNQGDTTG